MAARHFTPSINIIRDMEYDINYIPTPNSKLVYDQLLNSYISGIHSFNIIGSFGTGKSSFICALEQHLNKKKEYFSKLNGSFSNIKNFVFYPIIGDYCSITECFAEKLGYANGSDFKIQDLIKDFNAYYKKLNESKQGILIVIDEFGKFLEYAANNNPEKELYFIQLLAEYVNDSTKNIFLITTLHQNFNAYSRILTSQQQNEWEKVKGRLKEITFNEPVEQLLFLASERLKTLGVSSVENKNFDKLFQSISISKTFPLKDYFDIDFAKTLLPFDILSASVLTLALQQYGQNERSLFSFIESHDYLSIQDFDNKNPYYNLSCVYDYLLHNFYSFLATKYNPHYSQWATIRNSIERAEGLITECTSDAIKVIKTVGLLNIFASGASIIDQTFLQEYALFSLGIKDANKVIASLMNFKIIIYTRHNSRFKLFEGTDLDIDLALKEAANQIEDISNIVPYLKKYFYFPYIQAKEHSYRTGTPRFFSYTLSDTPINSISEEQVDGTINLLFSNKFEEQDVLNISERCNQAILYCFYKNTKEIKDILIELEKLSKVRENNLEDKIAVKELEILILHQKNLLNEYVIESLTRSTDNVIWFYKGERLTIQNHKILNRTLSFICNDIYNCTPVFKSELVNKSKLSSAILTARRILNKALVTNYDKENLGFEENKFPPERTIYLALINNSGIHNCLNNNYFLGAPQDTSFQPLWQECMSFLDKSKNTRYNLTVLIDTLSQKPFKLKQGFIEFWIPLFLFINRDNYALFDENGYISEINEETLDLISKNPKHFEIKAFDVVGVKLELFNSYRVFLNQTEADKPSNISFIELIKPFLTFYKSLPEYAKRTKRLSKKAIALRDAIALSIDPEKTFFEDFPRALGYDLNIIIKEPSLIEEYITTLQSTIRELRKSYDELINRVENFLIEEFVGAAVVFPSYKEHIQQRFKKLKKHLLMPHQKVFYQRLMSELDIRTAWINSISQAVIGKSLDSISDSDEKILYDKLKDTIYELDNLCTLSKIDVDNDKEDVFKLEITSFLKGIHKKILRLPKTKTKEFQQLETELKEKLNQNDKTTNIALLIRLLEEQIENEQKS